MGGFYQIHIWLLTVYIETSAILSRTNLRIYYKEISERAKVNSSNKASKDPKNYLFDSNRQKCPIVDSSRINSYLNSYKHQKSE